MSIERSTSIERDVNATDRRCEQPAASSHRDDFQTLAAWREASTRAREVVRAPADGVQAVSVVRTDGNVK